jgi:hypothetical protein
LVNANPVGVDAATARPDPGGALALTVPSFAIFAGLLLAARQRAPNLAAGARALAPTPLAQRMAREAEEIALHFTHPGRARDDAIALFWQVAPLCFDGPDLMSGDLDPDRITERMAAAVRASGLARDFTGSVLAEPLFRQIAHRCVTVMLAADA